MFKVYLDQNTGNTLIDGVDTHPYTPDDLIATENNGLVDIDSQNNGSRVLVGMDYTAFTDKDGNALGPNVGDTVNALNVIFSEKVSFGGGLNLIEVNAAIAAYFIANPQKRKFYHPLGSRYLLDPNEFCGWQSDGVYDQTMTADLGNVGGSISRAAGGLPYPCDVKIKNFYAKHYNSNAAALGWGWRIAYQTKGAGTNTVTYTDIYRECIGTGATAIAPRNYLSTVTQETNIDGALMDVTIPAGSVIVFGVEAPTAVTSNYYVQLMAGYLDIEEV